MRSKSLEQLEKDYWKEPTDFPTTLVKKSFESRKKPLADLTIEEIRLLVSQSIGLEHLVPLALEKLEEDILAEGDFYEGDLLVALSNVPTKFWVEHPDLFTDLETKIEKNSELIKSGIGEKDWNRIQERLK